MRQNAQSSVVLSDGTQKMEITTKLVVMVLTDEMTDKNRVKN